MALPEDCPLCYSLNRVVPATSRKEKQVSRFRKLSHVLWHCQYHLVWVPKYRYRVLQDDTGHEVIKCLHLFSSYKGCEIIELNVQSDHIHMIVFVPPKVSISEMMGTLKGRTAIRVFKKFPNLKEKPYWGNHFWAPGYCVDTIGLDAEMIRKYGIRWNNGVSFAIAIEAYIEH